MNFYLIWRKSGLSIKSYNRLRKYNSILPLFTIVYLWVKEYTAGYLASITGLPWSDYPCLLHRAMGLWVASSIQVHLMNKNFLELKSLKLTFLCKALKPMHSLNPFFRKKIVASFTVWLSNLRCCGKFSWQSHACKWPELFDQNALDG